MSGFHNIKGKISRQFGGKLHPDEEAYLSYHDVRVTRGDLESIKNDWLTDNAIAFWEEYLEHEKLTAYPNAHITLLRPSMAFMLMQTPNPLTLKDALPDFTRTTHIFLPINDNRNVEVAEGGSHWTLLIVSVLDGVAFHYDSLCPSNDAEARTVTQKMAILLGKGLRFVNMGDTPQQDNSSDCGVYVCLIMKHLLLHRLLTADANGKVNMSMARRELDPAAGRKAMLRIIEERRKEGERRRSRSVSPFRSKGESKSRSPPRIGEENENL
ncbi:Ulp1 protease family protein [Mytilinidion resinicola]|uniref:Ulp1 protease family protein n=1 Tax=Mytilinidion resinicola TaxID=574789 RepID=A0A6A6YMX7_9PEZI|nr:Ulp1 protease family protein [Mytilinidion resinicola]KAF2809909.1 Ulp1 protease family protein [Mytilinidion resinicola]